MKPTGLLIAVALLAVIGGGIWWSNKKQAATPAKSPTDASSKLLTIPVDQFQEIRIKKLIGETQDFKLVEANQFLARAFGKPGAGQGHGLQRAAKAFAALERGLGHALHPAVVAGEEAHNQVGLMQWPGTQNHGF